MRNTPAGISPEQQAYLDSLPPITYVSPSDLTPDVQEKRAMDMKAMYYDPENPLSMIEIGIIYGLTRERVRQIFKQFDIPIRSRPEARALAKRRRAELATAAE